MAEFSFLLCLAIRQMRDYEQKKPCYKERHKSWFIHTQRLAYLTLYGSFKLPSIQKAITQFIRTLCIIYSVCLDCSQTNHKF
jgi:hypothetical protein